MPLFSCIPFTCAGRVDVIEKRQCNLHDLPIEVERNAGSLEELYLDCNQICEITEGLCRCKKLRSLSLAQNKILRIPAAIGSLTALQELYLEDNELSDLPEELIKCSNLQILDLRLNLLTRLPDVVMRLSSLTHLYLFETSLTQLPPDIDKLHNLRCLDVRENQLRALPPAICQLKHLRELDLGRNELTHLPLNIGSLEKLEDVYLDHNMLSTLPDSLTSCGQLTTLDVSQNDLCSLPKQIGDLEQLSELCIAENRIAALPDSIGRLKKLTLLKADSNALAELTPSLGDCSSLLELYLFNNHLTTLPTSIGNLKELSVLAVDENQLENIPSTIGGCSKLSILTLRGNRLRELPLEMGRLANLRVLDLCDNILAYLPFTVNVLFNLRALWLSVDQTSPLVPFHSAQDPVTHVKVLTTYLLPQGKCQEEVGMVHPRRAGAGVNVRFGGEEGDANDEDESLGHFERKGTPHPKARSRTVTPRRQSIDGHFIPHSESGGDSDLTLSLRRKSTGDVPSSDDIALRSCSETESEKGVYQLEISCPQVESGNDKKVSNSIAHHASCGSKCCITITRDAKIGFGMSVAGGRDSEPFKGCDMGLFVSEIVKGGPSEAAGLLVGDKILSVNGVSVVDQSHRMAAELMQKETKLDLLVQRDAVASTSYSVCHGCDMGLFVSEIVKGGPSEAAGLLVGDKILSVNGVSVVDQSHRMAAELMQKETKLDLLVQRDAVASTSYSVCHIQNRQIRSDERDAENGVKEKPLVSDEEVISTTIERDLDGTLGFEVKLDDGYVVISSLVSSPNASKEVPIRVGDRLLSINGTTLSRGQLDLANSLMADKKANEVYVVVGRERSSQPEERHRMVSLSQSSLPSTVSEIPTEGAFTTDTQTENSFIVDASEPDVLSLTAAPVEMTTPSAEEVAENTIVIEQINEHQLTAERSESSDKMRPDSLDIQPFPTPKHESPNRIGPPIAPKPKISLTVAELSAGASLEMRPKECSSVNEPENMTVLSKIKKFENAAQLHENDADFGARRVPAKKPLLSEDDVRKMKEEESKKLAAVTASFSLDVEDYGVDELSLEHIFDNNAVSNSRPALVSSKRAERRFIAAAAGGGLDHSSKVSDTSETAFSDDFQRRQIWRQARYKFLETDAIEAERMTEQFQEITTCFKNVSKESHMLNNTNNEPNEVTLSSSNGEDHDCAAVLVNDGSALLLNSNIPTVGIST
ncbi:Protein lap1 [Toxocara canis]|uniref:Protein lap1 n=1 Tax=Toxocara canis TaxID=6265 RepID=A0A0B2V3W8_TOXCA|nr:Protein lap1 [Toxocara canis]